ncbi:ABC transporter permease subunit [Brevibacterium sp. 5221]|uniref:ABC transporter permease subunit n=1 Tax=Brevibacterium rongguiense TaxID=2695267 RepID=A0A6N9H3K0_9MICO|nr:MULTISPECIES: ABC transporter permease [Brevibacterium]MYM18600.1 ABC transporter permease subunit [Brevibacterium rongguiense]WAL41375.1 ABC transporter permease [Brevibacterium sp. BRM-1]
MSAPRETRTTGPNPLHGSQPADGTADGAALPGNAPGAGADAVARGIPRWRLRVPTALRTPLGIVGGAIIAVWVLIALFAPILCPADPLAQAFPRLQPPGPGNLLGTDELGRDVLSRVLSAARTTLPVAVLVVLASMLAGSILGAVAGYFGKFVDEVIMRLADLVFAFPTIILAMVIAAALGPGLKNAVVAILLVSWPSYARVARSLVMSARSSEYVVAGRLLGFSAPRSLAVDIAPNVASPLLVLGTLSVGEAILTMAGLSFLSLGAVPPTPDWGAMVSEGVANFSAWWIALFPGLAILTVVMAFNFIGDSLRDALDPRTARTVGEQTS